LVDNWHAGPANVVADDDGTGHGRFLEANEEDNAASVTLQTCP